MAKSSKHKPAEGEPLRGYDVTVTRNGVRFADQERHYFPDGTPKGKLLAEFKEMCERLEEEDGRATVYLIRRKDWNILRQQEIYEMEDVF